MYVPPAFAETNLHKLHDFIGQHSFATLVSHDGGEPTASHLPLLLERDEGPNGRLIGHMARANSQWQHADGRQTLAIFHGPHAYISPSWYEAANVVPTWNYVAVHVYGTLRLIDDRETLLEIVRRYVNFYEATMPSPWNLQAAEPRFIDGLLDAIVGFRIEIERIEGKWKLNQNHDPARREKVIRGLKDTGAESQTRIAELMMLGLEG